MKDIDWETVNEAIVLYIGRKRFPFPQSDEASVVARFGAAVAAKVLPVVDEIETDYFALTRMADFRAKHPEVSEEAIEALEWRRSYEMR